MALEELAGGFGQIMAPIIGGFLYELGGYSLPFYVLGFFYIVLFILSKMFIPPEADYTIEKDSTY